MTRVVFLITIVCISLLSACKEKDMDNGLAPMPVKECTIDPISGGAIIYYTLPSDRSIMYVMAEYKRNGKPYVERSSAHNNRLTIEGFNTSDPVTAKLYTVSKSEIRSDSALTVSFVPKESHISMAFKTLTLEPGYGGLLVRWDNIAKTELGVRLMIDSVDTRNEVHKVECEMYFSQLASERRTFRKLDNVRQFDTITYKFGVSLIDKWDNISDTAVLSCRPYYETAVTKPYVDLRSRVPFDNTSNTSSLGFDKICDNVTLDRPEVEGRDGGNSLNCLGNSAAQASFTFDLQRVYKLSRMKMWPRTRSILADRPKELIFPDIYGVNNVLTFEMWGTKTPVGSWPSDRGYWLDEFSLTSTTFEPGDAVMSDPNFQTDIDEDDKKNVWTYLGYYEVPRYDKMGYPLDLVYEKRNEGWEFDFPIETEAVRYIRFFVRTTNVLGSPPPNSAFQICELSFWGDDLVPQK